MKSVKIDNESWDKVKALADASGGTIVGTVASVLSTGLGELGELSEAITKIGRPITEGTPGEELNPALEGEEGASDNSWLWIAGAVLGIMAVRRAVQQGQARAVASLDPGVM